MMSDVLVTYALVPSSRVNVQLAWPYGGAGLEKSSIGEIEYTIKGFANGQAMSVSTIHLPGPADVVGFKRP